MLEYNNQKGQLILPEYGRNIQQMVEYCTALQDRQERNRCANTIIQSMGNLFPQLRDAPEFKHKLWDHLAIMSNFSLDIDYPYEVIQKENLHTSPDPVSYHLEPIKFRHYGKIIEQMIYIVIQEDESNLIPRRTSSMSLKKLQLQLTTQRRIQKRKND